MPIIVLNEVSKKYGKKTILDHFSFQAQQGEYIAIMGESGCGKSTLLNIIGLLEKFDTGKLVIDGNVNVFPGSAKANKILRETVGYLFQNFALMEDETVESNLDLALQYVHGTKKEKKEKMQAALEYIGLKNYEKRKIYELSGGEQQRVAIARVMLKPSKIILADEPTGSLDEKNRDLVLGLLGKLNDQGKTIVLVTHDKFVAQKCNRIVELRKSWE